MEYYERALQSLEQKKYKEAIPLFYRSLSDDDLDSSIKTKCYQSLVEISSFLNQVIFHKQVQQEYADYLKNNSQFWGAIEIYEEIVNENRYAQGNNLYKLWECYVYAGEVQKAGDCARMYLVYLYERKNIVLGFRFLDEIKHNGHGLIHYDFFYLQFVILTNNIDEIDKYLDELLKSWPEKKLDDSFFEKIEKEVNNKIVNWKKSSKIFELMMIRRLNIIEKTEIEEKRDVQKEFVDLLFEYLILFNGKLLGLYLGIKYGRQYKKKNFQSAFFSIIQLNNKQAKRNRRLDCLLKQQKLEFDQTKLWPDEQKIDERMLLEYDLTRDIAQHFSDDDPIKRKVFELRNDIIFLYRNNSADEANGLISELKEIDPDNSIFSELKNLLKSSKEELKRTGLKKVYNLTDVQNSLLEEVSRYTLESVEDSFAKVESSYFKSVIKEIENLEKEEITEHYVDYVVMFIFMNLFDAALKVLDLVEVNELQSKGIHAALNYEYLRIVCLQKKNDLFAALIDVRAVLRKYPLVEDERVCFLYIMGEILVRMNKRDEAYPVFIFVKRMNPNYRLVELRLKELEQNK